MIECQFLNAKEKKKKNRYVGWPEALIKKGGVGKKKRRGGFLPSCRLAIERATTAYSPHAGVTRGGESEELLH